MLLIADSGSTKTDWRLIKETGEIIKTSTIGLNPFFVSKNKIEQELQDFNNKANVDTVYFYGAGCVNEDKKSEIKQGLLKVFKNSKIFVDDDMIGAAKALFKNDKGIAAILGTGMNVCYYNGNEITQRGVSLGYILGDEGGGAYLGKELIKAYLYNDLPEEIHAKFKNKYKIEKNEILETVYKKPFPNKYLAGFSKFIYDNINNRFIEDLVIKSFTVFFDKHIIKIKDYQTLNLRLTGSIAYYFEKQLKQAGNKFNVNIDVILNSPIDELVEYHQILKTNK